MIPRSRVALFIAGALALTSCGDDGTGPSSTPTAIQSAAGNAQTGTVGETLPSRIRVRVTNAAGGGVSGVSVEFDVVSGGGTIVTDVVPAGLASGSATARLLETVTTDSNGEAAVEWTLGPTAGEQVASATVGGLGSVVFTATAEAAAPASLSVVSGDAQEGATGDDLAAALVVAVEDGFGNAVEGAVVSWQVVAGGAEFPAPTSMTDASGQASTTVTLRAPGPLEVRASVSGASAVSFNARASGTGALNFPQAVSLVQSHGALFDHEATQSLFALLTQIDDVVNPAALLPVIDSDTHSFRELVQAFRARADVLRAGPTDIPASLLGKTFVYDTGSGAFVDDPARTDAPANGVRFILYEINPSTGTPVEPLVEIGYVEIVDTGVPPGVAISVTVIATGDITVLSFDMTGTSTSTNLDLAFSGTVNDGATSSEFAFDYHATQTTFSFGFSHELGGYVIGYEQTGESGAGSLEFRLSDAAGVDELVALILFDAADVVLAGSDVEFNGALVAFFTGTLSAVTLNNIEGDPFTSSELLSLISYFSVVDALVGVYIDVWFAGIIFL